MNGIGAIGGGGVSVKDVMALRQQIFDRSKLLRELQQPLLDAGKTVHLIGGADVAAELDAKRAINQGATLAAAI